MKPSKTTILIAFAVLLLTAGSAFSATLEVEGYYYIGADPGSDSQEWIYEIMNMDLTTTTYSILASPPLVSENSFTVTFPAAVKNCQFSFADRYYWDVGQAKWVFSETININTSLISYWENTRYRVYYTGTANFASFEVDLTSSITDQTIGDVTSLTWSANDGIHWPPPTEKPAQVTIQLSRDGVWETLATVNYSNSYSWTVDGPEADNCKIRLTLKDYAGNTRTDESAPFSISLEPGEDSDGDGVEDDGDHSGIAGDYPCPDGITEDCDDNCIEHENPGQGDFDGDGIGDVCDECTDTDGDSYGNPGFPANTCELDNCPDDWNYNQQDCDDNGIGEACQAEVPCTDPNNWDRTYPSMGSDMAKFVTPVHDTVWDVTTEIRYLTAYSFEWPAPHLLEESQEIYYRLFTGDDYPCFARVLKNGVVIEQVNNVDASTAFEMHVGTFPAVEGDELMVEVGYLATSSSDDKKTDKGAENTYAQVEYDVTVATVTDITLDYYAFAASREDGDGDYDFCLMTTDECGEILDTIKLGTSDDEIVEGGCLVSNNDLLLVGYRQLSTDRHIYVAKYHMLSGGNSSLSWSNVYNFTEGDECAYSVVEASDGGYLVLSTTKTGTYNDLMLVKLSTTGSLVWQQTYTTDSDDRAGEIVRGANDGEYFIVGTTGGPFPQNWDVYIIKVDASGNEIWKSTLGQPGYYEIANAASLTADNQLIIAGQSSENGYSDALIMKASTADGSLIWYNVFGTDVEGDNYDNIWDILTVDNSGYALVGRTSPPVDSYWDGYFATTDLDGNVAEQGIFGGDDDDILFSVARTLDGGFIAAGFSNTNCLADFFAAKFIGQLPQQPVLASPTDGQLIYDIHLPLMNWNDVLNADSYTLEVADNPGFVGPKIRERGLTQSEYQVITYLKEKTWYWRVQGVNDQGEGPWSQTETFLVKNAKPLLSSPDEGVTVHHDDISLWWFTMEGCTNGQYGYQVQLATDVGFVDMLVDAVSSSIGDPYSSYYLPFDLPDGHYFWRVRYNYGAYYWSDIWDFTVEADFIPSCPVLFSYDGNGFREENPLLTACEASNYLDKVTDYYHLKSSIAPRDGKYVFQLREMEDEVTSLDNVELITVDHRDDTKVGCSVDGNIFTYRATRAPIAAVDNNGVDWTEAVSNADGVKFEATGPGHLVLTFPEEESESGIIFVAATKTMCPQKPPDPGPAKLTLEDLPSNAYTIEQRGSNGNWVKLPDIPTRINSTQEFVMPDASLGDNSGSVTIRISWSEKFSSDEIRQYVPAADKPIINTWQIDSHDVTAENAAAKAWSGFVDADPLVLMKGESVEFAFDVNELRSPDMTRDYIIRATGKYEPDYAVYSNLVPNRFQLLDNYPNPFNPTTQISFTLPKAAQVKLTVYNVLGQVVQTPVNEHMEAGYHSITWDGHNVATGIYLYRLEAGEFQATKKMMLLK